MKINTINISNYKSIDDLSLQVDKIGESYTKSLVGINESGKSNILDAISIFNKINDKYSYLEMVNQNNENKNIKIGVRMHLEQSDDYASYIRENLDISDEIIDAIDIKYVERYIFLERGENQFKRRYNIEYANIPNDESTYVKKDDNKNIIALKKYEDIDNVKDYDICEKNEIEKACTAALHEFVINNKVDVIYWKPNEEHLITSTIDLNTFKEDVNTNIPLRNIFYLAGYDDEDIEDKIEDIKQDHRRLLQLETQLSDESTRYLKEIWQEHKVKIKFRIEEQLRCKVTIQDEGTMNKDNYFSMQNRSDGFKQFISLIFTLSVENKEGLLNGNIIVIDEPENHLHPSGIRYMRDELIKIGKDNYIYLATHSNFMIDNNNKERNYIVRKNKNNNTIVERIKDYEDLYDDEVLREAFGINVLKDFITPRKILVEGLSDKIILNKAINKLNNNLNYAITNGKGDNIVSVASLLKLEDVSALTIVDDDTTGRDNKKSIKKLGELFANNVYTYKDLEPKLINKGTIEDALPREFIIKKYIEYYSVLFNTKIEPNLTTNEPILNTIKIDLQKRDKSYSTEDVKDFLEGLKKKVSEDFEATNMQEKTPILHGIASAIIDNIS